MTSDTMARPVESKSVRPLHRYNTRSSTSSDTPTKQQHSFDERRLHRERLPNHPRISSRQSQPLYIDVQTRSETTDSDMMQDSDPTESSDSTMTDIVSFPNPVRTPFPSPSMKSTQPFFLYPANQQTGSYGPSEGTWGQQEPGWEQDRVPPGTCILVKAANRAQMAMLVDEMGCMAIEQTDQT
jgi:hypothetical protein